MLAVFESIANGGNKMMKENLYFSNELILLDGRKMRLEYSMTECLDEGSQSEPYYGIKITKHLEEDTEAEEVCGVSYSKNTVSDMLRKMFEHKVTPISMIEILDDMITECI